MKTEVSKYSKDISYDKKENNENYNIEINK